MPVVPTVSAIVNDTSALTLPRYAQRIGYDECAFFGVVRPDPLPAVHSNKPLWRKSERDRVQYFLAEAQKKLETEIGYPLAPRYIVGSLTDAIDARYVDAQLFALKYVTKFGLVIEPGIKATTTISAGEAVNYLADPATVGPVATTVTTTDEIVVFYPDTDVELIPSAISIVGGAVTIQIPRCRLLTETGQSVTSGVPYDDTGPVAGIFLQTVDVKRVYTDSATQAVFKWASGVADCPKCTGVTQNGCIVVEDPEIATVFVYPGSYTGGAWKRAAFRNTCHYPDLVELNYKAGMPTLAPTAEDAIIRMAHAIMPHEPCNCEPPNWNWTEDRFIPRGLTRERMNCPFGVENGAWLAYKFAQSIKKWELGVL